MSDASKSLTFKPAYEFSLSDLQSLMERSFTGYIAGDVHFTPATFAHFVAVSNIHFGWSQIAVDEAGTPLGLVFIARRGAISRVAAMGVVPEAQGKGVGKALLSAAIEQSRTNGDTQMVLECFEDNTRARKLYESLGFRIVKRLLGFSRASANDSQIATQTASQIPNSQNALEPVDLTEVARRIVTWGADDLPWQVSGVNLMQVFPPSVGYRIGSAYAMISSPHGERIVIRGIAVPPDEQRRGVGTGVIRALIAAFPDKGWNIPPLCPEEYAPLFLNNGFTREPLHQVLMTLALT